MEKKDFADGVLAENRRRLARRQVEYDPVAGVGAYGCRQRVATPVAGLPFAFVPVAMVADPEYPRAVHDARAWQMLRFRHDFEYWAVTCVTVKEKLSSRYVPFRLIAPQRRVLAVLEGDRLAGRPMRLILLKARQWGGSTLIQIYMAWIQSVLRRNWHSLICAHVKDTSAAIRGMLTQVIDNYPEQLWDGDEKPRFRPFEGSRNIRELAGRGCRVTLASAEKQDAVRGSDYAMAHLSEVAFWPASPRRMPSDCVRAICGAIAWQPYTLIVMESTANGIGNFFHTEWVRCSQGRGDKHAVFVPWYEIEFNFATIPGGDGEAMEFYRSMNAYELSLWKDYGLTLEQIFWYHNKALEYPVHQMMQAECPTTADEAFVSTGANVFSIEKINDLIVNCKDPLTVGEIADNGKITDDPAGSFFVWEKPAEDQDYIAAVDIGGRGPLSDWSVIAVLTAPRFGSGDLPRVVAQWRGHLDRDLLAAKAMAIGRLYNDALLVVESNTLETENPSGDNTLPVLQRLCRSYRNLYRRSSSDVGIPGGGDGGDVRVGFHTNRRTKPLLIASLIAAVRDGTYVETDARACTELANYVQFPNGSYGARPGQHDDILMTRALAVYVLENDRRRFIDPAEFEPLHHQVSW